MRKKKTTKRKGQKMVPSGSTEDTRTIERESCELSGGETVSSAVLLLSLTDLMMMMMMVLMQQLLPLQFLYDSLFKWRSSLNGLELNGAK